MRRRGRTDSPRPQAPETWLRLRATLEMCDACPLSRSRAEASGRWGARKGARRGARQRWRGGPRSLARGGVPRWTRRAAKRHSVEVPCRYDHCAARPLQPRPAPADARPPLRRRCRRLARAQLALFGPWERPWLGGERAQRGKRSRRVAGFNLRVGMTHTDRRLRKSSRAEKLASRCAAAVRAQLLARAARACSPAPLLAETNERCVCECVRAGASASAC